MKKLTEKNPLTLVLLAGALVGLAGCGDDDNGDDSLNEDFDLGVYVADITSVTGTTGTVQVRYDAVGDGPLVVTLRFSTNGGTTWTPMTPQELPLFSRNPDSGFREVYGRPFDWASAADVPGTANVLIQLEVLDAEGVAFDVFGPVSINNSAMPVTLQGTLGGR